MENNYLLDTSNRHCFVYATDILNIEILGGLRIDLLDTGGEAKATAWDNGDHCMRGTEGSNIIPNKKARWLNLANLSFYYPRSVRTPRENSALKELAVIEIEKIFFPFSKYK